MICYNEYGEAKPVRITESEAIERQKAAIARLGHLYSSDEDALMDFMMIYWAWREKDPGQDISKELGE